MGNDNTVQKRTDKIKSWLDDNPGKYDIFLVILLYIAGVAIHYLIGNFPRRIATYADELLYFTTAQSIHDGSGILCMNAPTSFNKVAYSFVISPFFGIDDPILRVNMIALFNNALIMTSIFFVYLIGRELELNRGSLLPVLAIAVLWPDLMYSLTFMSENLNWPLILLAVYLWLKGKKGKHTVVYSVAFGAACYIGYLCKNIFLALLLCAVLFEAAYPFVAYLTNRRDKPDQRLGECFDKRGLIGCGIAVAAFAVCYILGNTLLFSGSDSNAAGAIAGGLESLNGGYAVMYLFFAFVYYIAASLIAVLIMPIIYSAANFKNMDTITQKTFSFLILYLLISCAMISYTISINEDIGSAFPRMHMRYLGFILLLLIVVFFKVLQTKSDTDTAVSRKQLIFTIAAAFFTCIIFKGFENGKAAIDQSVLNVYDSAAEVIMGYTDKLGDQKFYLIQPVSFAVFAIIIFIVCYYKDKKKAERSATFVFSVFMLMICFQNSRLEVEQMKTSYKADNEIINNVTAMNQYLENTDADERILYICSDAYSKEQKTFTVYFNYINRLCQCMDGDVPFYSDNGKTVDIPNTEFEFSLSNASFTYESFDKFDYIITDHNCAVEVKGVTPIDEASGEYYTLYKNDDPATVEFVPEVYIGEPLEITFSKENNNSEKYCASKLKETENGSSLTSESRIVFKVPVLGEFDSVKVSIDIAKTYENSPQRYIVVHKNEILAEGTMNGAGEIEVTVPVENDELAFDLVCPTAFDKDGDHEDIFTGFVPKYAFELSKITVG